MAVTIRPAAAEDAPAIAEVHVASWRWAYRGMIGDDALRALSVSDREAMWRDVIPRGNVVVAVKADRVVGFVAYGMPDRQEPSGNAGEVFAIYLLEAVVGRGIGRTLLTHATEELRSRGSDRAVLWVLEGNERARRFYEAAGWRWDGAVDTCEIGGVARTEVRYAIEL